MCRDPGRADVASGPRRRTNVRSISLGLVACTSLVALAACEPDDPPPRAGEGSAASDGAKASPDGEPAWRERVLRIAKSFQALGRVDDGGRMAPTDCYMPSQPQARSTASEDAA